MELINTNTPLNTSIDKAEPGVTAITMIGTKRANYLVSEKIYEMFSLCASSLEIDENNFDDKIKAFIEEYNKPKPSSANQGE